MSKDTIAFVSTYHHPSRDSMERMLRAAFPEYRLEEIILLDVVKRRRDWLLPNFWYMAKEYGRYVLARRITLRESYFLTTFLFRQIRKAMRARIDPERHVFSFQTQSLFDTSVPGVPHFIYTDHTHLTNLASPYFDRRSLRPDSWIALERETYRNAARVFTRSTDVTSDLIRHYGLALDKVVCVYAGSNVHVPEHFALDNAGYSNRRILFVGSDWERKGGPELVDAFRQVRAVYPDAHLTIAGARPSLELPGCDVLGSVPLGELPHHYARASVFCLPTRHEPFGIAFLEAMTYRLPIVGTAVGAVPDMVEQGVSGYLVPPGDTGRLAQALIDLLGDPERCRQFGEAGHQRVLENYTWSRAGERIRDQIVPLVGQPSYA